MNVDDLPRQAQDKHAVLQNKRSGVIAQGTTVPLPPCLHGGVSLREKKRRGGGAEGLLGTATNDAVAAALPAVVGGEPLTPPLPPPP